MDAFTTDNTFASAYLCRPFERGADLVVESATKHPAGHSEVPAGVVAGPRDRFAGVRALHVEIGGTLAPISGLGMERHTGTVGRLAG